MVAVPSSALTSWQAIVTRLVHETDSLWPPENTRTPGQMRGRLRHLRYYSTLDDQRIARRTIALVEARMKRRGPTLYMTNRGGSGSHWVESMLEHGGGVLACGEVDLPPAVWDCFDDLAPEDRVRVIDALHVLYSRDIRPRVASWSAVNSSHRVHLGGLLDGNTGARRALLKRDPLAIVRSITWRKPLFRGSQGQGMDDEAFLRRNVETTARFVHNCTALDFDLVVSYEDMRADPLPSLRALLALMGVERTDAELAAAMRSRSAEALRGGLTRHDRHDNLYRGPAP